MVFLSPNWITTVECCSSYEIQLRLLYFYFHFLYEKREIVNWGLREWHVHIISMGSYKYNISPNYLFNLQSNLRGCMMKLCSQNEGTFVNWVEYSGPSFYEKAPSRIAGADGKGLQDIFLSTVGRIPNVGLKSYVACNETRWHHAHNDMGPLLV